MFKYLTLSYTLGSTSALADSVASTNNGPWHSHAGVQLHWGTPAVNLGDILARHLVGSLGGFAPSPRIALIVF